MTPSAPGLDHGAPGAERPAHLEVARLARDAYGRLLAFLVGRARDVARAEDALGDALLAALRTWPTGGIPERPELWLLVAARRRLLDAARADAVRGTTHALTRAAHEAEARASAVQTFPDERVELLFACAHPAVDPLARTPLVLSAVLGLDVQTIASAFPRGALRDGQATGPREGPPARRGGQLRAARGSGAP